MRTPLIAIFLFTSACAYNWGYKDRSLPQGYKTVYVETFENQSQEVGVEIDFTNALIRQIERSGFATVTEKSSAELILSGTILSVTFTGNSSVTGKELFGENNKSASLFTNYVFHSTATIKARRSSDDEVIWSTTIDGSTNYQSSKLTQEGLRSSNPLYNQSSRKQTAKLVAKDMMDEVFNRLTENF